jgi:hypothetical protein
MSIPAAKIFSSKLPSNSPIQDILGPKQSPVIGKKRSIGLNVIILARSPPLLEPMVIKFSEPPVQISPRFPPNCWANKALAQTTDKIMDVLSLENIGSPLKM